MAEASAKRGPAITCAGLAKTFGTGPAAVEAVAPLDLTFAAGELTALVGPSGCGKSTVLRMVAGLEAPSAGTVTLDGAAPADLQGEGALAMAFQDASLLPWRTVRGNVALALKLARRPVDLTAVDAMIARVGLAGFEGARPAELSGGMRQRASLCRSLVHKPEVLILDEPFGALDAFTREDLWQTMHQLRQREPVTAVLITHDLRESVYLGDQVVVLSGRPAHTQHVMDIDIPGPRPLDMLYSPDSVERLAVLRKQIQIAQGRNASEEQVA